MKTVEEIEWDGPVLLGSGGRGAKQPRALQKDPQQAAGVHPSSQKQECSLTVCSLAGRCLIGIGRFAASDAEHM